MLKALRDTHLFKEVAYEGETSGAPDYVLEISEPVHVKNPDILCGESLLFPVVTLGIIPVTCTPDYGMEFHLRAVSSGDAVPVQADYASRNWVGIVALLLLPSDSWQGMGEAHTQVRFYEMAAYKVYDAATAAQGGQ